MKVKNIIEEDFINYKKPSMFIATSKCDFKCDRECGCQICQNSDLAKAPTIEIDDEKIIQRYMNNPITEAIVFGGLEPLDTDEVYEFIKKFRIVSQDDIVIYTGYYPKEKFVYCYKLSKLKNIIVKFGRFIPNRPHKFDNILGVELSSDNQFTVILEDINENNSTR